LSQVTPRRTRLVRVASLHGFRRAIVSLSAPDPLTATPQTQSARSRLVVVPTTAAARQLRTTLEHGAPRSVGAAIFPEIVTRDELYDRLGERLATPPRRLSRYEREAVIRASAAEAGIDPPFHLRPGLVAEIVRFYDQLRRQGQTVARFEELLSDSLAPDVDLDRGAARTIQQTRFLAAVFRSYERRLAASGLVDEHALRDGLISTEAADPARHVIVTVADWIADPHGLSRADFDLLARVPALEALDIVATVEMLQSGFHQRVHEWLPGIEEIDEAALGLEGARILPVLLTPASAADPPVFPNRDREEELIAIARSIKTAAERPALERIGVVFRRPLPYLYLARDVFGRAGIPYQAFDALPLAAEPFAAALDVVLEFAASEFTRASLVALLRSPHFQIDREQPIERSTIAAIDRTLSEARYLGELDRLRAVAAECVQNGPVRRALDAAVAAADRLHPLLDRAPASTQLSRLIAFLTSHVVTPVSERERRAQESIFRILDSLASACAAHDNRPVTIHDLASDVRRWIEEDTFEPQSGTSGIQLLDDQAARYGEFDDLVIVGLIEGDWPERPRRNVFYPPALLAALGWPSEKDRRGAAVASFVDLLRSPAGRVALSTFSLDDEALVEPSFLLHEAGRARLMAVEAEPLPDARVFSDEALSLDPPDLDALDEEARRWAALRLARTDPSDGRYHGQAGSQLARPLSISAIETYLTCPFKFFAQHVLRLEEEPEDDEVMDPKKRGQFVHEVFQCFFSTWQAQGCGAITAENLDRARALFTEIVGQQVLRLPEAEAALERTRLLGSSVAPGLAEIVFRMEAERPVDVVERLLEYPLEGEFEFAGPDGPRRLAVRGIADRLDLLADGTIRLIDYKLSSAPQRSRALQLPVYAICAEQKLEGRHGKRWKVADAAYIAFRGAKRIAPLFTARSDRDQVLGEAQARLVATVDHIEAGDFPPTPDDVFICGFCSFAAVCRKDYVGDV